MMSSGDPSFRPMTGGSARSHLSQRSRSSSQFAKTYHYQQAGHDSDGHRPSWNTRFLSRPMPGHDSDGHAPVRDTRLFTTEYHKPSMTGGFAGPGKDGIGSRTSAAFQSAYSNAFLNTKFMSGKTHHGSLNMNVPIFDRYRQSQRFA
eukprot:TRINITY_DN3384_c1_g1_i1.p1 TRINITY_DN3384_c1_g1~~TRINITY_DN3384_c1_g1_i1.p1  ORF type:complete len:147 (-),score=5.28 TRINITY_DN3384_c1_g1_i1:357-797(-)